MIRIARLDDSDPQFDDRFAQLLAGNETLDPELGATVSAILNNVRDNGVAALVDYTNRFDHRSIGPGDLEVAETTLQQALTAIPADFRQALECAAMRIREFHKRQKVQILVLSGPGRFNPGTTHYPPGQGRHLCARRQGSLPVVGLDECNTGTSGRRQGNYHGRTGRQ